MRSRQLGMSPDEDGHRGRATIDAIAGNRGGSWRDRYEEALLPVA